MGAFMIFDIGFKAAGDRKKFEKLYKPQILVGEKSNSLGFCAWTFLRNPFLDVVYFMGFMGYGDPHYILKECKKKKINIRFLSWIPINDKNSYWEKLRGKW
jgi:hypothetical protein